jgi:hypothetical protein
MSYRDHLKRAQFHAKAATRCLENACSSLGVDPDEPLQESGLIPPPPEQDVSGPDYIEPNPPIFDDEDNPQKRAHGRYIRLLMG